VIKFPKLGYKITENALAVLKERYLFRNPEGEIIENPSEMFWRVAKYVASVEKTKAKRIKWTEIFYDLMASGDFMPNTPTLLNSGRENLSVLAGCFVIEVNDTIYGGLDSIFGSIELMALIHKMGGGTGCSFHKLRPHGARVTSTGHVASGPVSFMRNFDEAIEAIQQGGMRRGAHMSIMKVDHPDIEEFIECKNKLNQRTKVVLDRITKALHLDLDGEFRTIIKEAIIRSQLTNMNISISLTAEFKQALKKGTSYDIVSPQTGKVVRQENAGRIFNLMAQNAWKSGEPGFIDLERINADNTCPHLGEIYSTNPCVVGDTPVSTVNEGPQIFEDLVGREVLVYAYDNKSSEIKVSMMRNIRRTGKNIPIMKLVIDKGTANGILSQDYNGRFEEHKLTPEHKLYLRNGLEVMIKNLVPGDRLFPHQIKASGRARVVIRNGLGKYKSRSHYVAEYKFGRKLRNDEVVHHKDGNGSNDNPENLEIETDSYHKSHHCRDSNLSGIRSLKGSKNPNFNHIKKETLIYYGCLCVSKYGTVRNGSVWNEFRKEVREIELPGRGTIERLFGSYREFQEACILSSVLIENHKVVSVEYCGKADVFNGTVDKYHNYFIADRKARSGNLVTGILSKNCGEQPLRPFESCTLGSIAVSRMVEKKNGQLKFDYVKFKERIYQAIRFLDNVLDAQKYPVSEIKEESQRTRKIGLGVMGFADLLIKFGIPYGSQDCIDLIHVMMSKFEIQTRRASIDLAREKGKFPAWKKSTYGKQGLPMRNAMRTTIAPTGSISGIAGVSFGIEPLYGLSFTRRILDGKTFVEVSEVAKEALKRKHCWSERAEQTIREDGTLNNCEWIPPDIRMAFKTAHEINPEEHLIVQAAFQKYIDNAVSKTINLPNSATVEDVNNIFRRAIELKCKGITVYRDASREEQVLTTGKAKFQSIREVRKRPRKLNGTTYEKQVGECGKLFVIVNSDKDGYPFEIFIEAGKSGGCMQSQLQAIGRLISKSWQSGLGLETIVKQLTGITCHQSKPSFDKKQSFLSCADAIAKIIQEHFIGEEGEEEQFDEKPKSNICSYCGGPMIHEGHCSTCTACFKSLCG